MAAFDNKITGFLRSDHFTNPSKKTILEIAITKALDNTTVAGANKNWWVYDATAKKIEVKNDSATSLLAQGYELDHVFERQYISGLFFAEIGQNMPLLDVLNDIISLANMPANLVWVPKAIHAAKTKFFSPSNPPLTVVPVGQYMELSQPIFKAGIDEWNIDGSYSIVKQLVKAIKMTPWYLGGWVELDGHNWYT